MSHRLPAVFSAVLACSLPAHAQDPGPGSWSDRAPAPAGVYAAGSAVYGGGLHVFGGMAASGAVADHYRFDPALNSWSSRAPLPAAAYYNAGAAAAGYLYSFGAMGATDSGRICRYDPAANTWTTLAGTVPNGAACSAAVLDDLVYLTGGVNGGATVNALSAFNPTTGGVAALAPMPAAFAYHGSAAVASTRRLYVLGGNNSATPTTAGVRSTCYEYDPANNIWNARAPVSNGTATIRRDDFRCFSFGPRIYVPGGGDGYAFQATLLEYDSRANTWTARASLPDAPAFPASGRIGNRAYVCGGSVGGPSTRVRQYAPPVFGQPPAPPADLAQSAAPGGWTGRRVQLSARLQDPDANELVRLEVEVRHVGESWADTPTHATSTEPQGLVSLWVEPLAPGDYQWRARAIDEEETPSDWVEFGAAGADFRSGPAVPVGVSPVGGDALVDARQGGTVRFVWSMPESDPNAPAVAFDVEVYAEPWMDTLIDSAVDHPGLDATIYMSTSADLRFWRVRSRAADGTVSGWSPLYGFRVVHDDRVNHSAGDAERVCGMSAGGGASAGAAAILIALVWLVGRYRSSSRIFASSSGLAGLRRNASL